MADRKTPSIEKRISDLTKLAQSLELTMVHRQGYYMFIKPDGKSQHVFGLVQAEYFMRGYEFAYEITNPPSQGQWRQS